MINVDGIGGHRESLGGKQANVTMKQVEVVNLCGEKWWCG